MQIAITLMFSFIVAAAAPVTALSADYVWIEGESSAINTMKRHRWYDSVITDSLSGGQWLSHFAEGRPPEAEFRFEVPKDGEYFFWIR